MNASIPIALRLFLLGLFGFFLSGCATKEPFVKEILTAWSAPPLKTKLEVTDIVERHTPIGMDIEAALEFLRLRKFRAYPAKDGNARRGVEQVYVCSIDQVTGMFTTREIRVILDVNFGRVVARKGYVFHHSI